MVQGGGAGNWIPNAYGEMHRHWIFSIFKKPVASGRHNGKICDGGAEDKLTSWGLYWTHQVGGSNPRPQLLKVSSNHSAKWKLLAPCCLHCMRLRHLPVWPDNWGVVVFVTLCLQLVWMIVMLWRWLGKEQRRMLSTALPRNKNLPHTCRMNCLALLSNSGAFNSCNVYCFFAPYWVGALWYGACCTLSACVGIVSNFLHVVWHGQINLAFVVVPIQCYSNTPFACPITLKFVVFFKCIFEMLCMFFANVFHAKVIDNQCKLYQSCVMFPKARYQLALSVSPCLLRCFSRSLFANNPACGRPYMPHLALM